MGEDLVTLAPGGDPLGVDRHHDALAPEFLGRPPHETGVAHGRRVDRDLVGAREQQRRMSSRLRTPPPTVSGMKQFSAVRRTTSSRMPGPRGSR
jgi:hypothetical protein